MAFQKNSSQIACLHDQNKSGFFGRPALSSQSEQLKKYSKSFDCLEKKPALQKSHFCFDHVNRLKVNLFCPRTKQWSFNTNVIKIFSLQILA